jgi:hypothetical protein
MSATPVRPQIRLALSRSQLRLALLQLHAAAGPADPSHAAPAWWKALRAEPGTRVLLGALAAWWTRQPWHQTAALLAESAKQLLRPVAQRNPLTLVLAATAIGGALVLIKPWRWLSVSALATGLLPEIVSRVLGTLRPMGWAELLNSWLQANDQAGPRP